MDDFFQKFHDDMENSHRRREGEFERLRLDQCAEIPGVGDIVVVAAGPLGMGFDWMRWEAVVLAVGQSSYKVRFTDYQTLDGQPFVRWIHPAVVTDVVRSCAAAEAAGGSDADCR